MGSQGSSTFPMTATIHIFVLLLVVLAAVAVVARRVGTAPSILLVIVGVVLGLVPGAAARAARTGVRAVWCFSRRSSIPPEF